MLSLFPLKSVGKRKKEPIRVQWFLRFGILQGFQNVRTIVPLLALFPFPHTF